jgi:hypothetical protein
MRNLLITALFSGFFPKPEKIHHGLPAKTRATP